MVGRSSWLAGGAAFAMAMTFDLAVRAQLLPIPDLPPRELARDPAEGTLAHQIERHPQCLERTNGCEICVRSDSGRHDCSFPGIACQPGKWRCSRGEAPLAAPKPRL